MKIDLHCHTKKIKEGDDYTRNVSAEKFKEAVNSAGVKVVAITNHNAFDIVQYEEFTTTVGNDFQIWPGIEFDVQGEKKVGHVIVISNPKKVHEFSEKIKDITENENLNRFSITVDDLLEFISNLDCIVISHYMKPKSLDDESIKKIREGIVDSYRFFYEPSNFKSLGILLNHDYRSLYGSDVKDWEQYDTIEFADLKLDIDSFEQFLLLSKKDDKLVGTLLNKKSCANIDIGFKGTGKGKNKGKSVTESVNIYDDINVIFGTKGTGKSDVLKQIKEYYKKNNIEISEYIPNNAEDEIQNKLNVNDNERKLSNYGFKNFKDELTSLGAWKESEIVQLKDFIDYVNGNDADKNKAKLHILDSEIILTVSDKNLNDYKNKLDKIRTIIRLYEEIQLSEFLNEEDISILYTLNIEIEESLERKVRDNWIEYNAELLTNSFIYEIKKIVEKNTETKTRPTQAGLYDFITKRVYLINLVNDICSGFDVMIKDKIEKLGDLEENKMLYIKLSCKMYNKNSRTAEFKANITGIKEVKENLFLLRDNLYTLSVSEKLSDFNSSLIDKKFKSLDDFLGVEKNFVLNETQDYKPSSGEATMIILQEKLSCNKDVYILDEPEKSLGNTYVNDIIVPKLIELAKLKKVVVIATHNANIAVRTFPYTSILKTYDAGIYRTYVGTPFTNKLKAIMGGKEDLNWKLESVRILEGGKEAFEERGEIYD